MNPNVPPFRPVTIRMRNGETFEGKCCLKCSRVSGDAWEHCEGTCPVDGSPHYDEATARAFQRLPLEET